MTSMIGGLSHDKPLFRIPTPAPPLARRSSTERRWGGEGQQEKAESGDTAWWHFTLCSRVRFFAGFSCGFLQQEASCVVELLNGGKVGEESKYLAFLDTVKSILAWATNEGEDVRARVISRMA